MKFLRPGWKNRGNGLTSITLHLLEKYRWLAPALIFLGVALALGPLARSDFVEWDDYATLAENPAVNPPTMKSLWSYWTTPFMSLYFPVTQTVWHLLAVLDYSPDNVGLATHPLHLRPGVFKLANLVAHAITGWLVMRVLGRLGLGRLAALMGALVFVLHPLQVESVAWTSGLKDILCALFMFASIERYLAARSANPFALKWAQAFFFALLALLSKPLGMVLPGLLLVIEVYFWILTHRASVTPHPALSHEYAAEGGKNGGRTHEALQIAARLLPFFIISIVFSLWIKLKIQTGDQVSTQVDLMYRPFVALDSISFYIQKLFWPFGLAFDYGRTPISILHSGAIWKTWIVPVVIWIALILFAWKKSRLFFWLAAALFLIPILPVLGLVKFEFMDYSTVADHYVYSSMLGAALLVGFCVERWMRVMWPVSMVVVVLLGIRSFDQTGNWRDGQAVALQTLKIDPDSWPTWGNLAGWHLDRGQFVDAEQAARKSLEIRPFEEKNRVSAFNLGVALIKTERYEQGIPLLVKVVRAEPSSVPYRLALAMAYSEVDRYGDAERQYRAALHFDPGNETALKGVEEMNRLMPDESTRPSTLPSE